MEGGLLAILYGTGKIRKGGCGIIKLGEGRIQNLFGRMSRALRARSKKRNTQVTGHTQGDGQFRPTKILSRKDKLALAGLAFDPEGEGIERRIRRNPRMMVKEARERIRKNPEKGKDSVLEELKRFSAAMKLETAPRRIFCQ